MHSNDLTCTLLVELRRALNICLVEAALHGILIIFTPDDLFFAVFCSRSLQTYSEHTRAYICP